MRRGVAHWLVLLAVFAVVTPLAMLVVFEIAVTVSPPRTPEGYGLMPIGQAMLALLLGPLSGLVVAWVVHKRRVAR